MGHIKFVTAAMLLLLLGGWCLWFYPYDDLLDRSGTPLGADFAMFYVAGQVVTDAASSRLYDQAEHQRRLQALFPGIDPRFALPYRYPPAVALICSPLARLPYPLAFGLFLALSLLAWAGTLSLVLGEGCGLPADWRRGLLFAAVGWPVFLETLIGGQAALFALLIAAVAYKLLQNQQQVLAGAVMAFALYKPNVLALVALGCLLRYPRMWRGFVPAAAMFAWLCYLAAGWEGQEQYVACNASLAAGDWDVETPPWKVLGLAPWFELLLGTRGALVCFLTGSLLVAFASRPQRTAVEQQSAPEPLWFAMLLIINALFNLYTPLYDLSLFVLAAILLAQFAYANVQAMPRPLAQIALVVLFFGPHFSQAVAKLAGVHPFPLIMVMLAIWQVRVLVRDSGSTCRASTFSQARSSE